MASARELPALRAVSFCMVLAAWPKCPAFDPEESVNG
jgi:hypothetical protein